MVTVIGPKDPRDSAAINTTSRSDNWSQGLSPFYLGPVRLYSGYVAQNVENAWQYSKVYSVHLDDNGEPSKDYFEWAKRGWENPRAVRYPMGKGAKPQYSYWDGEKMSYVQARRKIYIPIYSAAVRNTDAFKILNGFYRHNNNQITLWDFDGYNHRAMGLTWEQVIDSEDRKCGHGFVLAMMLEGVL